jgi:DNA-binding MarR family transcriptional regulator
MDTLHNKTASYVPPAPDMKSESRAEPLIGEAIPASHILTASQAVLDLPRLIERMHRRFLDVVRIELTRLGINDISPVQAMMLCNIGDEEISVRDLIERGYYLGSNASYNLKQLVECGYVNRQASARDRRSARLKLTDKGRKVLHELGRLTAQCAEPLTKPGEGADFESAYKTLRRLERRWSDAVRFADDGGSGDDF